MSISNPLLLFDSGVGGLTIAHEIRQLLPQHPLVYVADNRNFPYGILSEEALVERVTKLFPKLIEQYQPCVIVIACNSASTIVLDKLRAITTTPIIGVVPAIKPAARISRSRHIGLLATPGTVQRMYTQKLIQDFAPDCKVTKVGSNPLVEEAENKFRGNEVDLDRITHSLQGFLDAKDMDTLVLGCTHFPLLKTEIQTAIDALQLQHPVQLIDSGEAIARRAAYLIGLGREKSDPSWAGSKVDAMPLSELRNHNRFLFTQELPQAHQLIPYLRLNGFEQADFIDH